MKEHSQGEIRVPSAMRWAILSALLFLMLTPSRVQSVREILLYLRWAPQFLLGAYVLIIVARNNTLPRPINVADCVILAFIALAILSSLYSINPKITFLRSLSILLMYVAVFWGMWLYVDTFGVENLVRIVLTVIALVFSLHLAAVMLSPSWTLYFRTSRFAGWADNPGVVGSMASLSMPLALWKALSVRRWHSWVLVGAMLLAIVMAHTRLEVLAMLVGSGYFLLRALPSKRLLVIGIGAAYLLVFVSWSLISPGLYERYSSELPKGLLDNVAQQVKADASRAQLDTEQLDTAQLDTEQAQLDTVQAQLDTAQLDTVQERLDTVQEQLNTVQLDTVREQLDSGQVIAASPTISGSEVVLEHTTGTPHAIASRTCNPNPS